MAKPGHGWHSRGTDMAQLNSKLTMSKTKLPLLPFPFDRPWSVSRAVEMACVLEASAPKVGNVHPGASFSDMEFAHFVASAVAIGPVFRKASQYTLGHIVHRAVLATRKCVGRNTNLGTLLLMAPLAHAYYHVEPTARRLRKDVALTLQYLYPVDGEEIYAAIRAAQPGGLGSQHQSDVTGPAPADLRAAMAVVADIDAVARQYTNDFADVFDCLVPWLREELLITGQTLEAICRLQLRWLAHEPDGLIVRKAGAEMAAEVQRRAAAIGECCLSRSEPVAQQAEVRELDQFLRADGHRRNPGTTADLIAAAVLVLLLEG